MNGFPAMIERDRLATKRGIAPEFVLTATDDENAVYVYLTQDELENYFNDAEQVSRIKKLNVGEAIECCLVAKFSKWDDDISACASEMRGTAKFVKP